MIAVWSAARFGKMLSARADYQEHPSMITWLKVDARFDNPRQEPPVPDADARHRLDLISAFRFDACAARKRFLPGMLTRQSGCKRWAHTSAFPLPAENP